MAQGNPFLRGDADFAWPINLMAYDRSPGLTEAERQELALVAARSGGPGNSGGAPAHSEEVLHRLLTPLEDICQKIRENYTDSTNQNRRASTIRAFVLEMNRRQTSFWAWSEKEWIEFIAPSLEIFNARLGWSWRRDSKPEAGTRTRVLLTAYWLGALPDIRACGTHLPYTKLARLAFGEQWLSPTLDRIITHLRSVGYAPQKAFEITRPACIVLLLARSPLLEDITEEHIRWVHATTPREQYEIATFSRVLVSFGILKVGIPKSVRGPLPVRASADGTLATEWEAWCNAWRKTSTLEPTTLPGYYTNLLKIGRWLNQAHPEITSPAQWTATIATECVAAITQMTVGQYIGESFRLSHPRVPNHGQPIKPRTISVFLGALRRFFQDLQESEQIPFLFNPQRYLALPRSVHNKIGPDPRVIDRPLWAKLVWAGQHLEVEDLPSTTYPVEMVRAVAAVWLFTALRSDEIYRLQLGCIEWPMTDLTDPETGKKVNREQVCYLHIPANKTSPAFKNPWHPTLEK